MLSGQLSRMVGKPPFSLRELPWRLVRETFRAFRAGFFTVPEPETQAVTVEAPLSDVRAHLGRHSYAPNWETSYNYHGEDLNLSRVAYVSDKPHGVQWWQTHVRGWEQADGGTRLRTHWEPEPTEHPKQHLNEVGFSWSKGTQRVWEDLQSMEATMALHETLPAGGEGG